MITVRVPHSIHDLQDPFREFVKGMLNKLDENSYKTPPEKHDLVLMLKRIREEVTEFEQQCRDDPNDPNMLQELYDIANTAFVAYVALTKND